MYIENFLNVIGSSFRFEYAFVRSLFVGCSLERATRTDIIERLGTFPNFVDRISTIGKDRRSVLFSRTIFSSSYSRRIRDATSPLVLRAKASY